MCMYKNNKILYHSFVFFFCTTVLVKYTIFLRMCLRFCKVVRAQLFLFRLFPTDQTMKAGGDGSF